MTSFENLLSEINDFGKYQKLSYLLICLAALLPPIGKYWFNFIQFLSNWTKNFAHLFLSFNMKMTSHILSKEDKTRSSYAISNLLISFILL